MIHTFPGLTNHQPYYAKIFTLNPQGRINNRADLPVLSAVPKPFPQKPADEDAYTLITEITSTQTYTAPEDGWFLIEVHGASGNGGNSGLSSASWYVREDEAGQTMYGYKTGGSGAGGSCSASIVKLRSGDPIVITIGNVGEVTSAAITSTAGESYELMRVNPSGSGTDASVTANGSAGVAGTAYGGNLYKTTGSNGRFGTSGYAYSRDELTVPLRTGGAAATPNGNPGGSSSYILNGVRTPGEPGRPGKVRVLRGEGNLAALG